MNLKLAFIIFGFGSSIIATSVPILRTITLPHEFTFDEQRAMDFQLDKLRLGVDLFLAQQGSELPMAMQQRIFTNIWPLVSRLFASDFGFHDKN